jgi:indole-3-glycerol phosphate synthase
MATILEKILEQKKVEIAALDLATVRCAAESAPAPRDFLSAVARPQFERPLNLIAELKRASPSKGVIAPQLDLFEVADIYVKNGAAAISVLTDEKFFLGKLETLQQLRMDRKIEIPLLRKDFIIDEVQLYEACAAGADAALLIAAALPDDGHFAGLHALALELGLTPLVEVHNENEMERTLLLEGLKLIGINNRNLATFEVSLETTERLLPFIPAGIAVVAESGIFSAADVARVSAAGVDAVLVGEALMSAPDIGAKVRELANVVANEPRNGD